MKSKALTFSWHHTVFTGGRIVFIKSGTRPQDQSYAKHHCWSPGERGEAAEPCTHAARWEKCTVIKAIEHWYQGSTLDSCLCSVSDAHGVLHAPGCQNILWRYLLKPDSSVHPTPLLSRSIQSPWDGVLQTWGCCRSSRMLKPGEYVLCQLQGKSHCPVTCWQCLRRIA